MNTIVELGSRGKPSDVVRALIGAMSIVDAGVGKHLSATSALAVRIAVRMGLDASTVDNCRTGALLHDVGMIGVAPEIIGYPGMLLDAEYDLITEHAALGESLLSGIPSLAHLAPIVRAHHERIDGSGYPDGLAGTAIPIEARIIAVADAFQTMTSDVVYRGAVPASVPRALEELVGNSHSQFDTNVVAAIESTFVSARSLRRA